jgi:hypothetical protein
VDNECTTDVLDEKAARQFSAVTLEAITRALNERGVRPARGTRWHASSLANLLAGTEVSSIMSSPTNSLRHRTSCSAAD